MPQSKYEALLFKRLGDKDAALQVQSEDIARLTALVAAQTEEIKQLRARLG